MYQESQSLGCILEPPDERDYLYEDIAGGPVELPDEFVVSNVPHMYQNGIDACVGFACASAKSVQEGEKLSPRYQWHLAKKAQRYQGWGTSVSLCIKEMITGGALPYGSVDESVSVNREDYMRLTLSNALSELTKKYKIKSYWRAGWGANNVQALKTAIYNENIPLITSMQWYREYDRPIKGFLPKGVTMAYGHCFLLKGWRKDKKGREYLVFQNSWRETWGDHGDFYIYTDELADYKLGSFYVLTDIESDKAKLLSQYKGKLVKKRGPEYPKVYYIGAGKIAWIKNEPSFEFGRDAGFWGGWGDIIDLDMDIEEDIIF